MSRWVFRAWCCVYEDAETLLCLEMREREALTPVLSDSGRGVSSVVRRCVHRATGHEFAVKIMEVTAERLSPEQLEEVREATQRETHILRQVAGHPHISEAAFPVLVS